MARNGSKAVQIATELGECQLLLSQGFTRREISEILQRKYGLTGRTARRRLKDAIALMVEDVSATTRTEMAAQLSELFFTLIRESREGRQYGSAVAAANSLARLVGILEQGKG